MGYNVSDQSVGNVLKRNGIPPVQERSKDTTWASFLKRHQHVIAACDFFTAEVITPTGLITYYILFFIHLGTRKVHIAGVTPNPNEEWMKQVARNLTMEGWGFLSESKYLIHDRDSKFCESFCGIIKSGGVKPLKLPPRTPNLKILVPYYTSFKRLDMSLMEICLRPVWGPCLSRSIIAISGMSKSLSPLALYR